MNAVDKEFVTLGADVGGKDAHMATHEHILALRKLLRQECRGVYSQTVKEFALILRVDGSVQRWQKSGVETVAMQKKNSLATADIFVPKEVWSESWHDLRKFIAKGVQTAIAKILQYAQERGVAVSSEALKCDVDAAITKYLMTVTPAKKENSEPF